MHAIVVFHNGTIQLNPRTVSYQLTQYYHRHHTHTKYYTGFVHQTPQALLQPHTQIYMLGDRPIHILFL